MRTEKSQRTIPSSVGLLVTTAEKMLAEETIVKAQPRTQFEGQLIPSPPRIYDANEPNSSLAGKK